MTFAPIHTDRLLIRTFQPGDTAAVATYTTQTAVMTYIEEGVMTVEQTAVFVQQHASEGGAYPVLRQTDGQLIGHLSFHSWFAPHTYEIGWVFHPDYQRQGYATEAARALLEYGFATLQLHRVIATCQPENPASYRVMEKLGMRREGHFRQCIYRGDEVWWDEYFYAILANEWRSPSSR